MDAAHRDRAVRSVDSGLSGGDPLLTKASAPAASMRGHNLRGLVDQVLLQREGDRLRARGHAQLGEDAGDMEFDR